MRRIAPMMLLVLGCSSSPPPQPAVPAAKATEGEVKTHTAKVEELITRSSKVVAASTGKKDFRITEEFSPSFLDYLGSEGTEKLDRAIRKSRIAKLSLALYEIEADMRTEEDALKVVPNGKTDERIRSLQIQLDNAINKTNTMIKILDNKMKE